MRETIVSIPGQTEIVPKGQSKTILSFTQRLKGGGAEIVCASISATPVNYVPNTDLGIPQAVIAFSSESYGSKTIRVDAHPGIALAIPASFMRIEVYSPPESDYEFSVNALSSEGALRPNAAKYTLIGSGDATIPVPFFATALQTDCQSSYRLDLLSGLPSGPAFASFSVLAARPDVFRAELDGITKAVKLTPTMLGAQWRAIFNLSL